MAGSLSHLSKQQLYCGTHMKTELLNNTRCSYTKDYRVNKDLRGIGGGWGRDAVNHRRFIVAQRSHMTYHLRQQLTTRQTLTYGKDLSNAHTFPVSMKHSTPFNKLESYVPVIVTRPLSSYSKCMLKSGRAWEVRSQLRLGPLFIHVIYGLSLSYSLSVSSSVKIITRHCMPGPSHFVACNTEKLEMGWGRGFCVVCDILSRGLMTSSE